MVRESSILTDINVGEPLRLTHRGVIERLLVSLSYGLSEYCFANLYLFRQIHHYRLVQNPFPFIVGTTYDGARHAMPLIPFEPNQLEILFQHASCVYPLPEDVVRSIPVGDLQVVWNEADSDYLYDAMKLARLAGAKSRSKRTQARQFFRSAHPAVMTLTSENLHRARELLDRWADQLPASRARGDYDACAEALTNFDELSLEGILVTDGANKNYSFLIASRLPDNSLAVHFAKGDRDIVGAYPFMYSQLAARVSPVHLNFEQDLGLLGLRQAKRALDPSAHILKCRLIRGRPIKEANDDPIGN